MLVDGRLSVHQIDYNKNNNKKNNLITLCMRHNAKANFLRDYCKEYFYNLIKIIYD